jgi:hypothetical protein
VHRRLFTFAVTLVCTGQGCSQTSQPWPVDCPPSAPAQAQPIRDGKIEELAGRYEVTLIPLSYGPKAPLWRGHLELATTDTLHRYYIETIGGYKRHGLRPLAGQFRHAHDPVRLVEEAEVEDGILFLGCRRCADGSPHELRLLAATPTTVWGLWYNPQSGIERVIDSLGNPLPNPAGHFCMRRVES